MKSVESKLALENRSVGAMVCQWRVVCCFALSVFSLACCSADYDLIIRNGTVVDGSGSKGFKADVAIKNGRIAVVGTLKGSAKTEINARGHVVSPGFIDVHTHAEDVFELPLAENFIQMGVTTVVMGNCGSSFLNVGELFRNLERTNSSVNIATLIGHGTVRKQAMGGSFDRKPTDNELRTMEELVGSAMRDGAVGLSTGLIYLPGTFAQTEELIRLARVASSFGGIYATHMRDEGKEIDKALTEAFQIGRAAAMPVEISHLKLSGKPSWGRAQEVLAFIQAARETGLEIHHDLYVYTASSTGVSQLVPEHAREGGKFKQRLANADFKLSLVQEMKQRLVNNQREDYSYAYIANYSHDKKFNGLNIVQAAKRRFGSGSVDAQIEMILEIEANGGASANFHGIDEKDLRVILSNTNTMIASDSGIRKFGEGVPHPRGYGNNARVLGEYVRKLQVLTLEEAVRRMTSLPANTFRLNDRGLVKPGYWADLVVFDPESVSDKATFDKPHQYPNGFDEVIVNGAVVLEKKKHTGAKPGVPLKHKPNVAVN